MPPETCSRWCGSCRLTALRSHPRFASPQIGIPNRCHGLSRTDACAVASPTSLLLTTYYSLLTTCYLLPTTYYLLLITYYLRPTTYYLLLTRYSTISEPGTFRTADIAMNSALKLLATRLDGWWLAFLDKATREWEDQCEIAVHKQVDRQLKIILTSHDLLLTTHYSLLTTYYLLLTTHCSLLTTHYSLITTHYSLRTTHYSLITNH